MAEEKIRIEEFELSGDQVVTNPAKVRITSGRYDVEIGFGAAKSAASACAIITAGPSSGPSLR